jgi:purine-nucleoside phosphorylase
MKTPHINAEKGDFAKTVLMPGDPLRSKFIAENFLEEPRLINNVRGVQGYTGRFMGKEVSVMASGMGMPSMAIYSYELFNFFDVENIIRIGTAGAFAENLRLKDVIVGLGTCTNSTFASQYHLAEFAFGYFSDDLIGFIAGRFQFISDFLLHILIRHDGSPFY